MLRKALGIVQDDIQDWNETAASIADIYRHAYVTIAATASYDGSQGCFRHLAARSFARLLQNVPGLMVQEGSFFERDPLEELHDDPLL